MGKLKNVLSQIGGKEDSPNTSAPTVQSTSANTRPPSIKSDRRVSKASSKESKEVPSNFANDEPTLENGRRISLRSEVLVPVKERRTSQPPLPENMSAKTQTQKVAAPVTHNLIKPEEVEEVTREREHDRHYHHIQHHVQPVKATEILDEVHHTRVAPVTAVNENFSATAEDAEIFESLGSRFQNLETRAEGRRETIDLGEKVEVKEHHHIHNVIQPVIEKETHERHRIHTTVPVHQVTHEAPIIHDSIQHEPLDLSEFLKRGGSLTSNITHSDIGKELLTKPLSNVAADPELGKSKTEKTKGHVDSSKKQA